MYSLRRDPLAAAVSRAGGRPVSDGKRAFIFWDDRVFYGTGGKAHLNRGGESPTLCGSRGPEENRCGILLLTADDPRICKRCIAVEAPTGSGPSVSGALAGARSRAGSKNSVSAATTDSTAPAASSSTPTGSRLSMPSSSSTPIPEQGQEAAARALAAFDGERFGVGGRWDYLTHDRQERHRAEAAVALEAAHPHLLAAFTERLLGDEAVEAVARGLAAGAGKGKWELVALTRKQHFRTAAKTHLEAALASIDAGEGSDRG